VLSETERYLFLRLTKQSVFGRQRGESQRSNRSAHMPLPGTVSTSSPLLRPIHCGVANTIAFGDSEDDLDMLQVADYGVATDHALASFREEAPISLLITRQVKP
jgi:hypothetical protein